MSNMQEHGEEEQDDNNFAELVQAWRVYITVDGSSTCPTDFLPIGIAHYQTFNTVSLWTAKLHAFQAASFA